MRTHIHMYVYDYMYVFICMCLAVGKMPGKTVKSANIFILIRKQAFTFYSHWGIICSEKNRASHALFPHPYVTGTYRPCIREKKYKLV